MPKRSEPAAELSDADLDASSGGVPLLLPAVRSVPEPLFTNANTSTAQNSSTQTIQRAHLTTQVIQQS